MRFDIAALVLFDYEQPRRPSEDDLGTLDLYIQEAERVFALLETR